jgi:outer membrane lipoprotein-sorting protein
VITPDDAEVLRLLQELAAVQPDATAAARALKRARTALTTSPLPIPARRWKNPMKISIAASVLVLASGTFLLLGWIRSSGAAPAFAEVQEKVQGTRSVTLTVTNKVEDRPIGKVRLFVQAPGLLRVEYEDDTIGILERAKHQTLTLNPKQKKAILTLGLSDMMGPPNIYELFLNATQDKLENLPEETIDGKKAIGYRVRFGLAADKKEARVWVDPTTKLPVRIEQSEKDKSGRETAHMVFSDFVFDAPLDAALFRMTPPEGYTLVTMGSAAPLPAAPAEADKLAPLVTPGVGIGPARFGMSKEEVIKVLGPPDSNPPEAKGIQLLYFSRGFQVDVLPKRGLWFIHCVTQKTTILAKVNDFQGKTKEGIAMGASEKMIVDAYGKPNSRETIEGMTDLRYNKPDIRFRLREDKLVGYMLYAPPPNQKPD